MRVAMSPGRDGSSRARSTARSLENAETTSGMTSRVARALARRRSAFAAPIAASNASNAPARIFSTARESDASRASRDATTTKATESKASREAASRETASGTSDATNARETGRRGRHDPSGRDGADFDVRAYAASVGRVVRETAAKGGSNEATQHELAMKSLQRKMSSREARCGRDRAEMQPRCSRDRAESSFGAGDKCLQRKISSREAINRRLAAD